MSCPCRDGSVMDAIQKVESNTATHGDAQPKSSPPETVAVPGRVCTHAGRHPPTVAGSAGQLGQPPAPYRQPVTSPVTAGAEVGNR